MDGTEAVLTFDSFDGGGPQYNVVLDSDIVSYKSTVKYKAANHNKLCGAGYTITYTFTGVTSGETKMTVEKRSLICGSMDHRYSVKVDDDLNVTIEKLAEKDISKYAE